MMFFYQDVDFPSWAQSINQCLLLPVGGRDACGNHSRDAGSYMW